MKILSTQQYEFCNIINKESNYLDLKSSHVINVDYLHNVLSLLKIPSFHLFHEVKFILDHDNRFKDEERFSLIMDLLLIDTNVTGINKSKAFHI